VRDDEFPHYTRIYINVQAQTLQNEHAYDKYYTCHPIRVANMHTDQ